MSAAKHTPGPLTVSVVDRWPFKIVTTNAAGDVVFARDMPCNSTRHKNAAECLAGLGMDPEWKAAEHNARAVADEVLRAAAPDLLAALQSAVAYLEPRLQNAPSSNGAALLPSLRAAIAKATGAAS